MVSLTQRRSLSGALHRSATTSFGRLQLGSLLISSRKATYGAQSLTISAVNGGRAWISVIPPPAGGRGLGGGPAQRPTLFFNGTPAGPLRSRPNLLTLPTYGRGMSCVTPSRQPQGVSVVAAFGTTTASFALNTVAGGPFWIAAASLPTAAQSDLQALCA